MSYHIDVGSKCFPVSSRKNVETIELPEVNTSLSRFLYEAKRLGFVFVCLADKLNV